MKSTLYTLPGARTLRSAWHLLLTLRMASARRTTGLQGVMDADYAGSPDPWGYTTSWGADHLQRIGALLERARVGPGVTVCDIGCGEGYVTRRVAQTGARVIGVDVSPTALSRAAMAPGGDAVEWRQWNLLDTPLPARYEFVLATGVFECFANPGELARMTRHALDALQPGGHLLVTTTRQHPLVEAAPWTRVLPRGTRGIEAYLIRTRQLRLLAADDSPTHRLSLFQRLEDAPR
jgi:2-polyprenyl-3-methyl-5-hydroxy-6-metoxy-1,4-benzoquinol methylase